MSKLAVKDRFIDLSDYGRAAACRMAQILKDSQITPIHVTCVFGVVGLMAVFCIVDGYNFLASIFLILKSVIDAIDGELSRVKNKPSHSGRFLDSIFDIILNFLFFLAIWWVTEYALLMMLLAFIGVQLQGTLYNYYYVILRHNYSGGDITSKIFQNKSPKALPDEDQGTVNVLFMIFNFLYAPFDKLIYLSDKGASRIKTLPSWFMTMVSIYGLGFQLLLMAVMITAHMINFIIPFFIGYTILIPVFIGIRKSLSS